MRWHGIFACMNRHTIVEAAAELDTLSEVLGSANDEAVLEEVRDRLRVILASLTHTRTPAPALP